jgi:hypothetical protein
MKINYGFERNQRTRAKAIKKEEKLRLRAQETAERKALKESRTAAGTDTRIPPAEDPPEPESK